MKLRTVDEIIERKGLPSNLEAERLVLGAVISRHAEPDQIAAALSVDDFSIEPHRIIYNAILAVSNKGDEVNRASVGIWLNESNNLQSVGGLTYLASLDEGLPHIHNIEGFVRTIQKKTTARRIIQACDHITLRCLTAGEDAERVLGDAERLISEVAEAAPSKVQLKSPLEIKQAFPEGVAGFFNRTRAKTSVPSPWSQLNETILGFQGHKLYLIAARPGDGKSVAAAQIAYHAALCGFGVALFSLEMPADEILVRMTCCRSSVEAHRFQAGYLNKAERQAFKEASDFIDSLPIWIDDTTGSTVPALTAAIKRHRAKRKIDLVIIDYLQLMDAVGATNNRNEAVSEVSRGLKRISREFGIPVIALSQLSRANQKEKGREPELPDLRDSGSLEQDADLVLFLHPHQHNASTVPELTSPAARGSPAL